MGTDAEEKTLRFAGSCADRLHVGETGYFLCRRNPFVIVIDNRFDGIDAVSCGGFHGSGEDCLRRNIQRKRVLGDDGLFVIGNGIFKRAADDAGGIIVENDAQIVFMSAGENMDGMACVNDGETRIEFDDVADLDGFEGEPADHAVRLVQNVVGGKAMEIGGKVDSLVWISAAAPDTGLFAIVVHIIFKRMPSGGQLGDIACILEDFVFAVA